MAEKAYYPNNPITEALIDIQLDQPLSASPTDLKSFQLKLDGKFPQARERQTVQATFQLQENKPVQSQLIQIEGYEFWNAEKTEVIQARKNGFSFSRLKPYLKWEDHFPAALKYWSEYQRQFGVQKINRVAVRFINTFQIPEVRIEPSEYFNCFPAVPDGLPQDIQEFFQRMVVKLDSETTGVITFAPALPASAGHIGVLLDIDVFFSSHAPFQGDLKKRFEELHDHAEKIFETYITEKSRRLMQ